MFENSFTRILSFVLYYYCKLKVREREVGYTTELPIVHYYIALSHSCPVFHAWLPQWIYLKTLVVFFVIVRNIILSSVK